jgi:hypothetical protein
MIEICSLLEEHQEQLQASPFRRMQYLHETMAFPFSLSQDEFIGVLVQRIGRTVFDSGSEQVVHKTGDLLIWRCEYSLRFGYPPHSSIHCLRAQTDETTFSARYQQPG